jgi:hypothetical protein
MQLWRKRNPEKNELELKRRRERNAHKQALKLQQQHNIPDYVIEAITKQIEERVRKEIAEEIIEAALDKENEMPRARVNPEATACLAGNCSDPIKTAGYCNKHYTEQSRERARAAKAGCCAVPNCERPHAAKGYCQAHYRDFWAGRPMAHANGLKKAQCSMTDCIRVEYTASLCRVHFEQRRRGDLVEDREDFWNFVRKEVVMSHDRTRVVGLKRRRNAS